MQLVRNSGFWLAANWPRWPKHLLIAGVLIASALFPWLVSQRFSQFVPLGVAGVAAALMVLRWPALGLFGVYLTGMFIIVPGLPGGLNLSIILVLLLLGIWALRLIRRQEARPHLFRPVRPALILVVVALLALALGQLPWYVFAANAPLDAQLGGTTLFVVSVGLFLYTGYQVRELRWLKALTYAYIGLAGFHLLEWMLPGIQRLVPIHFYQHGATGSLFWLWLVALAFGQAWLNPGLRRPARLALLGVAAATAYVTYFMGGTWKSGWLPVYATFLVIAAIRNPRLALVGGLASLTLIPNLAERIISSDVYSYYTRVEAWAILLEIVKVSPLLGLGPANYHFYTPLYPIRGYYLQFNSHNQYVDLVAQTGLVGLALYLWFFVELGWMAWRLLAVVPDGFARAYIYSVLGGLAGMLVAGMLGDWTIPFVYNVGLIGFRSSAFGWMFLGGLLAIAGMVRNGEIATSLPEAAAQT